MHRDDSLVPAWPKAAPGIPWHVALELLLCRWLARAKSTIAGPLVGVNPQFGGLSSPGCSSLGCTCKSHPQSPWDGSSWPDVHAQRQSWHGIFQIRIILLAAFVSDNWILQWLDRCRSDVAKPFWAHLRASLRPSLISCHMYHRYLCWSLVLAFWLQHHHALSFCLRA